MSNFRRRINIPIIFSLMLVVSVSMFPSSSSLANAGDNPARQEFSVQVVSSAADQVTGGDARLHIDVPHTVPLQQVEVWVNSVDERSHFSVMPGTRTLTGVIDGMNVGENSLTVKANGKGLGRPSPVNLTLTDYPITGPIFSGPHQYPFVCTTMTEGLGQPIPDDPVTGTKVFDANGNLIGYSRDCSAPTLVVYKYWSTSGGWKDYTLGMDRPSDMAQTTTLDGKTVDFIVRWERGTINRFIYSIAMLAPYDTNPWELNKDAWNRRLIFYFDGGVGIGHSQGETNTSSMLYQTGLARGYAILYSSGTRTATHYNLQLGGETALMVKERFIERYDVPMYTVGLGGSGGAIQQYIYGQDHPGLLDAAIPQYSYPDMVTQAVYVADCELLEFYMDVLDNSNPLWKTWTNRTLLEGMNASNTLPNPYNGGQPGSDECVNGWRGLSPLALNPLYGEAPNEQLFVPQSAIQNTEWSHFGDIVNIVGVGADGYARSYWDNVGVQYGLQAVADGQITPDEFLKLNGSIGGWKSAANMVQEGSPFYPPGVIDLSNWDPWSSRNQVYSLDPLNHPAARTQGSLEAMQAVYKAGLVFTGNINIPIIDWRNYLENFLNMHNSQQSFAERQRMLDYDGNASNQVIWFTDVTDPNHIYDQTPDALQVMDEWMQNILAHPEKSVAENKPALATDRCFDSNGVQIASGPNVWNGILDNNPPGACTQHFKIYSTSRRVAGGSIRGSIFKCQLISVPEAIGRGDYGVWTPDAAQTTILERIFPQGVCDFSQPDAGLPPGG
jgi:Tannase-like family of unknown function (DUF6351)